MTREIEELIEEDAQKGRFLTFSVCEVIFGLEIKFVSEIISIQPITEMPEAPAYVKGVINLRGKILPVIDMRVKFKKEQGDYNERTCIIVVDMQDVLVGLIVDSVDEVLYIPDESIVPPPDFKSGFQNRYVWGIGKVNDTVKLLIDCDRILSDEEFIELNQIKEILIVEEQSR